jgi:hypothetical protein
MARKLERSPLPARVSSAFIRRHTIFQPFMQSHSLGEGGWPWLASSSVAPVPRTPHPSSFNLYPTAATRYPRHVKTLNEGRRMAKARKLERGPPPPEPKPEHTQSLSDSISASLM